jgi:hypothetical protein
MTLKKCADAAKGIGLLGASILVVYGLSKCSEKVFGFALEKASTLLFS